MSQYDSYTQGEDIPFDPNSYVLPGAVNAAEKDADGIERDNSFRTVPPGEHTLVVAGFFGAPTSAYQKVFVNGQLTGFDALSISVKLALPDDPRATISDRFTLPPSDPAALRAYFYGVPAKEDRNTGTCSPTKMSPGILGNRFTHFVNRLGFVWTPGQPMPADAQRLGSWIGRYVVATVEAGNGSYVGKDGVERQRSNQIKWFSYKLAGPTVPGVNVPVAAQRVPAVAPAVAPNNFASSGLANI